MNKRYIVSEQSSKDVIYAAIHDVRLRNLWL